MSTDTTEILAILRRLEPVLSGLVSGQDALTADMSVLKTDVSVLKSDMAEVKSNVSVLKADMAEVKSDILGLKLDMARMQGRMDETSVRLSDLNARLPVALGLYQPDGAKAG